jgi:hypothetical protein
VLFGAAIGSSLVSTLFLGQNRGVLADGVLITGFVIFVVWASTYPVMLRQMDRQHLRERFSLPEDAVLESPHSTVRLYVVRAWMVLLTLAAAAAALIRAGLGT